MAILSTDLSTLFPVFQAHRDGARPLVLATIVGTAGSTYRKAGARMLLEHSGETIGILGGGCFEGDLAEHAAEALSTGRSRVIEYDMRGDDDLIWGLGLGCNGLVRILLQPLRPANAYQPFGFLFATMKAHRSGVLATVVGGPADLVGAALGADRDGTQDLGLPPDEWPELVAEATSRQSGRSGCLAHESAAGPVDVFYDVIRPAPHLLLLGAGPDALPVATLARQLCWRVSVADHRSAWVKPDRFPPGCEVFATEPVALAGNVKLDSISAAVVMSHSFNADADYLRVLAQSPPDYVGLLGPAARRDALLEGLDAEGRRRLADCARGPVGLDLGGRSPQAIALSLIAEIQSVLCERDARPMDERLRPASRQHAAG